MIFPAPPPFPMKSISVDFGCTMHLATMGEDFSFKKQGQQVGFKNIFRWESAWFKSDLTAISSTSHDHLEPCFFIIDMY